MPSGRTHLRIELLGWALCALGVAALWTRQRIELAPGATFLSSYLFSSLFLSPDLDLHNSRAARRWGVARPLWRPYAWIFPHRSVSHHLFLGPLTRLLYLAGLVGIALAGLRLATGASLRMGLPSAAVFAAAAVGIYIPNQLHTLADRLTTRLKRRL